MLIATWGSFTFAVLYTSNNLYQYAQPALSESIKNGEDAENTEDTAEATAELGDSQEDSQHLPQILQTVLQLPQFLQNVFWVVSCCLFLAGLTIFGALGVKLSITALPDIEPGPWVQTVIGTTMIACIVMSLWGSCVFLGCYTAHRIWLFVTTKFTHTEPLQDSRPKHTRSFVESWPVSLQVVFYFDLCAAYFSFLAIVAALGLYASHWAFNDTQPLWLDDLVAQTLINGVLVVLWGTLVLKKQTSQLLTCLVYQPFCS